MAVNKIGKLAAAAAATGALVIGGAVLANAATGSPSPAAGSTSAQQGGQPGGKGGGGSNDTPVTGEEAAKVTAAVKAKDSSVTVSKVQKDPDGSYDVFGTKSGAQVMLEVSKDLKTITQNAGGPGGRGGRGGPGGGSNDTPVTGDEAAKVTAAVKAKDSSVTVSKVQKDPDGSYDVFGTKSGAQVMFDVSADLKTITQNTGGPGGGQGGHGQGGPGGQGGQSGQNGTGNTQG